MGRKLFIVLLTALFMAGLAAQAVAEEYAYQVRATTLITGRAASLVINGTTGYELSGYGVTALNLTPANPEFLGQTATPGLSYSGAIVGTSLVVADGDGLAMVNIASPTGMFLEGWLGFQGSCRSLAAIPGWAFCAVQGAGLVVVNISNPSNPTIQTTLPLTGTAYYVTLATIGGVQYAFVAMGESGLAIVNVQDPAAPTLTGSADTPGLATGVAVETTQNIAVLADGTQGVAFVNVATPSNPQYVANYPTMTRAIQVAVGTSNAVVTELRPDSLNGVIEFFNYSGTQVGSFPTAHGPLSSAISGNTVYISETNYGIEVVDITSTTLPVLTGTYHEPAGGAVSATKNDNYAYVTSPAGLTVVNMTNLDNPVPVRTFWTGGECYDVFIHDNKAYALDFFGNLVVVNVANPAAPESLTTNPGSQWLNLVGLRSMAFYQPATTPFFYVGSYKNTSGYSVIGYDLVDPMAPVMHSFIQLGDSVDVKGITVADNKLFIAATTPLPSDTLRGVYIYDLTMPEGPVYMGHFHTTGNARMTAVNGNFMYVAAEMQGLVIADITTPGSPTEVGSYPLATPAYGVTYAGNNKIFVTYWGGGMVALDVTTPSTPVFWGRVNTPGLAYEPVVWDANNVLVCDNYALEVDSLLTVGVIPDEPGVQTPTTFKLNGASPNPFNSTTMISFALPVAGKVDVAVYDAMGRMVALPFSGTMPAGEHRVPFEAQGLSSGVYFLQVSSAWGEQSGKLVLLK